MEKAEKTPVTVRLLPRRRPLLHPRAHCVTCAAALIRIPTRRPQIVTGFLGSGKTTFINTILNDQAHKLKIAIIENEFGEARILRVWAVPEQLRAWRAADLPHVLADWHRRTTRCCPCKRRRTWWR